MCVFLCVFCVPVFCWVWVRVVLCVLYAFFSLSVFLCFVYMCLACVVLYISLSHPLYSYVCNIRMFWMRFGSEWLSTLKFRINEELLFNLILLHLILHFLLFSFLSIFFIGILSLLFTLFALCLLRPLFYDRIIQIITRILFKHTCLCIQILF